MITMLHRQISQKVGLVLTRFIKPGVVGQRLHKDFGRLTYLWFSSALFWFIISALSEIPAIKDDLIDLHHAGVLG